MPLIEKYGNRIVYNLGLGANAKVCDIIEDGHRKWPFTNSTDLLEVKENLTMYPSNDDDEITWTPKPNGHFSINSAWEETRTKKTYS